jgi:hypothetical protein
MQRVIGVLVASAVLVFGRAGSAEPEARVSAEHDVEQVRRVDTAAHCYLQILDRYLPSRSVASKRPASELTSEERKQFERQVARFARFHELTLRLQEQQELREALDYARELALHEKKLAFTKKLLEARQTAQLEVTTPQLVPASTSMNETVSAAATGTASASH